MIIKERVKPSHLSITDMIRTVRTGYMVELRLLDG